MSKRLQVLLPPEELSDVQRLAKLDCLTVGEWVRQALREARIGQTISEPENKLGAIRRAVLHSVPTGDIGQMLDDIGKSFSW